MDSKHGMSLRFFLIAMERLLFSIIPKAVILMIHSHTNGREWEWEMPLMHKLGTPTTSLITALHQIAWFNSLHICAKLIAWRLMTVCFVGISHVFTIREWCLANFDFYGCLKVLFETFFNESIFLVFIKILKLALKTGWGLHSVSECFEW